MTPMSKEEDSKKSGIYYVLLIAFLLIILISFFTIPFASVGNAVKKSGLLGAKAAQEAKAAKPAPPPTEDLSALRSALEKAASNNLSASSVLTESNGFQIQVAPPATIDSASGKVQDVLSKNHYQFVEAYDKDFIRIIVILKSSQWHEFSQMLGQATELNGFDYKGPSDLASSSNSSEITIARIEILRKPSK